VGKDSFILPQQDGTLEKRRESLNSISSRFGLSLSPFQMRELDEARIESLRLGGLVEFGASALSKLVYAFCDSPYVLHDNYAETLAELQDSFYRFRGEADVLISDDEIIAAMRNVFNDGAGGSCEYFDSLSLEDLLSESGESHE